MLDFIYNAPTKVYFGKNKESEVKDVQNEPTLPEEPQKVQKKNKDKTPLDKKAVELAKKNKAFGFNPPHFLLTECKLMDGED